MLPRTGLIHTEHADYLLFLTGDFITNEIYKTGGWDQITQQITQMLYSGVEAPLVLDIGANLGSFSVPIAKDLLARGGEVIAFEPQEIIYYQLCANIVLNRLDNLTAYNKAVGNYNGEIDIPKIDYHHNPNTGAFSFIKQYRERGFIEHAMKEDLTTVPMLKLDSLKLKKSPTVIKMDVEGYELDVFKGACQFLAEHHYPTILLEIWNVDYYLERRQELMTFIQSLGYDLFSHNDNDYIAQHQSHARKLIFSEPSKGTFQITWND